MPVVTVVYPVGKGSAVCTKTVARVPVPTVDSCVPVKVAPRIPVVTVVYDVGKGSAVWSTTVARVPVPIVVV